MKRLEERVCKNCRYYSQGCCEYIEYDDEEYPHDNQKGFGIVLIAPDDQGVTVEIRVDKDFGCNQFIERKKR